MLRKLVLLIAILGLWTANAVVQPTPVPIPSGLTGTQLRNAIDLDANTSGHVNGAINVKAPPYLAKGDCSTDDAPAIQRAIDAACAIASGSDAIPSVFLPATQYSGCYKLSQPLSLHCRSLKFIGAGRNQAKLSKNDIYAPSIIIQDPTGSTSPFVSSITATWQSGHLYAQWSEIKDSNGNIEVATTGDTSGGSQPTWPTTQGSTTTDGGVKWTLEVIGGQLLSGTGSAFNSLKRWVPLDMSMASAAMKLNGLSAITLEAKVDQVNAAGSGLILFSRLEPGMPKTWGSSNGGLNRGSIGSFQFNIPEDSKPRCNLTIGGAFYQVTSSTSITLNHSHHIACDYDGSTIRIFVDGHQTASQAASGTITGWNQERYWFLEPEQVYGSFSGFIDSVRISNTARYTSNFTPPISKLASDGNTLMLLNWVTSPVLGTIKGTALGTNAFFPYETWGEIRKESPDVTVADMNVDSQGGGGGPGIWAAWSYNSHYEWLRYDGGGNGSDCDICLVDNDFQSHLAHIEVTSGAKDSSEYNVAVLFGNQSTQATVLDLGIDGVNVTEGLKATSEGYGKGVTLTDRSVTLIPFHLAGGFTLEQPFVDSEGNGSIICAVMSDRAWAPNTILGGELDLMTANSGAAYLCILGKSHPVSAYGTSFGGSGAAEIVHIIDDSSNPLSEAYYPVAPAVISNSSYSSSIPLVSSGGERWVIASRNGIHSGAAQEFASGLLVGGGALTAGQPTLGNVNSNVFGTYNFGRSATSAQIQLPEGVTNGDVLGLCLTVGGANNDLSNSAAVGCYKVADNETRPYTASWANAGVAVIALEDWKSASHGGAGTGNTGAAGDSFNLKGLSGIEAPHQVTTCVMQYSGGKQSLPSSEMATYNRVDTNGLKTGGLGGYYTAPATQQSFTSTDNQGTWAGVQFPIYGKTVAISATGTMTADSGLNSPKLQYTTIYSVNGTAVPTCDAAAAHSRVCVSDARACRSGTTYAGGGSTACELWCNQTNWIESGSGC
jgi:hypothetical protein